MIKLFLLYVVIVCEICLVIVYNEIQVLDVQKTLIWGPGLTPDYVVLPARYFFILAIDKYGSRFTKSPTQNFVVNIKGVSPYGLCRTNINIIDRGDGSIVVRYTVADWCDHMEIEVLYNNSQVASSPYYVRNKVYSEKCYCPQSLPLFMIRNYCPMASAVDQIASDLQIFKKVNFSTMRETLVKHYTKQPETTSLCHYAVKQQQIWRQCYGKYTGFKIFMDSTLLALSRVVLLPDMEFYLNLGDWPLSKKLGKSSSTSFSSAKQFPYPIFSWSGSHDSYDIVLPTYDLMESTVENMGRVTLDMLSVQHSQYPWEDKENKAFWRGRDSRRERLHLIELSREHPHLLNASLTNFFFFRDEEEKFGPTVPRVSFMEFFKFKYQINIDGTVASYRFPFLLGGDALVLKQNSPYYEHFYNKLEPFKHYVPFKRDLSDLIDKIHWAQQNEWKVLQIIKDAREFVDANLLPQHIYCYHVALFREWSERLQSPVIILPGMEKLNQTYTCSCKESTIKDEL